MVRWSSATRNEFKGQIRDIPPFKSPFKGLGLGLGLRPFTIRLYLHCIQYVGIESIRKYVFATILVVHLLHKTLVCCNRMFHTEVKVDWT